MNFLKTDPRFHETKGMRRLRATLRWFGLAGLLLIILSIPFAYAAGRIALGASQGRAALMQAQAAAERLDFKAAKKYAEIAHDAFLDAGERVGFLKLFSFIPGTKDSVTALDGLLASGAAASSAASEFFAIGSDVLAAVEGTTGTNAPALPDPKTVFKDLTPAKKRQLLAAFAESGPRLATAKLRIAEAIDAFDRIPASELDGSFGPTLTALRLKLDLAKAAVDVAAPLSGAAPELLGYPTAKRYLFFLQNDTELRPSGGFLGVVGSVIVQDATVLALRTDDTYAFDGPAEKLPRPAPPKPIKDFLGVNKWYLRDSNWSPDFAVSAAQMEKFYMEESLIVDAGASAVPVDGVVAMDTRLAADVLRITGPVTAGGIAFDADNLVDELEHAVEVGYRQAGIPFDQRKDIVGELVTQVTTRLQQMPVSRLLDLLAVVQRNFTEGHVAMYSHDPELRAEIDAHGWGGRLVPVQGDYVLWVDANLGSLKSDPEMQRTLSYKVKPAAGGGYEAAATMTFKNTGTFTWKTSRYRTYSRLYAPLGSTLIGVDGAMFNDKTKDPRGRPGTPDEYDELGRRVFGAFIAIEPGETRALTFRYRLPPSVVEQIAKGTYHLGVEKQPGTVAHGLSLEIDTGKAVKNASPAEERSQWGDSRYKVTSDLRQDRAFEVSF